MECAARPSTVRAAATSAWPITCPPNTRCQFDCGLKPNFAIAVCDPVLADAPARDDRVSAIAAGARHLLETLGVWQQIEETAQPLRAMEITDSHLEDAVRPAFLHFDAEPGASEPL